jgi:hypothetical protein
MQDQRRRYTRANTCLPRALRALGVPVPLSTPGPFHALRDGNQMLAPLGKHLVFSVRTPARCGKFIMWSQSHFVAVEVTADGVVTHDNGRPPAR